MWNLLRDLGTRLLRDLTGSSRERQELLAAQIRLNERETENAPSSVLRLWRSFLGWVLLSLQAMAKRLAHMGIKTYVVGQITEPAITERDLLIVGSGSGESMFPLGIARKAKSFHASVVHIGANPESSMKAYSDLFVRIGVKTKLNLPSEIPSIQPMTSLFEQSLLLLGDIVALELIGKRKINMHELWQFHANLE